MLIGLWGAAHMAAFIACQIGAMVAGRGAPAFAMSLNISVSIAASRLVRSLVDASSIFTARERPAMERPRSRLGRFSHPLR